MYEEFTTLVTNVGFPIAISVYLLVRFEKRLETLNQSIVELTRAITTLLNRE